MRSNMEPVKVGDTLKVWWRGKTATVIKIGPHSSGRDGWQVLYFGDGHAMTLTPECRVDIA